MCPHLEELKIIIETEHGDRERLGSECLNLAQLSVDGLLVMEEERRELSQGRPLVDRKELQAVSEGSDEGARVLPVCKTLTLVELVGCYIDREARMMMKRSACEFKITPLLDSRK